MVALAGFEPPHFSLSGRGQRASVGALSRLRVVASAGFGPMATIRFRVSDLQDVAGPMRHARLSHTLPTRTHGNPSSHAR